MKSEFELIDHLSSVFRKPEKPDLGIGDDAAILTRLQSPVVWTTDSFVESIHFERAWLSPEDLGFRVASASISDIAAMGAQPKYLLLSLHVPKGESEDFLLGIARGIDNRTQEDGARLVGGNITRGDSLSLEISVLGDTQGEKPLRRSGAQPGDILMVSGVPGTAAFVLRTLKEGNADQFPQLLKTWCRPVSRIELGTNLRGLATSCIDISDGLLQDAGHLARASSVDLEIHMDALPQPDSISNPKDQAVWQEVGLSPSDDYELLFTIPPKDLSALQRRGRDQPFKKIGSVLNGNGQIALVGEDEATTNSSGGGWDHFSK